jgi:hypothetical protein
LLPSDKNFAPPPTKEKAGVALPKSHLKQNGVVLSIERGTTEPEKRNSKA